MRTRAEIKQAVRAAYARTPIYREYGAWTVSGMDRENRVSFNGGWTLAQHIRARVVAAMVLDSLGFDRQEIDGSLFHLKGSAESRVRQFLKMKEYQNGQ
jgi:hypothetical protein